MTDTFIVACAQNCATDDIGRNIGDAIELITAAADDGASLICLPENVCCIEPNDQGYLQRGYYEGEHPALPRFRDIAAKRGVWLSVGSLTVKVNEEKVNNRTYVIDDSGEIVCVYNKIHLFDVTLKDDEAYMESNSVSPGEHCAIAALPWGKLGLSICYDVRFPHLYRTLAQAGADFISIPAAFTVKTGAAHWHVLVRARAIETGCFIFAAAQFGQRPWGRRTYGHSLIVDPWGQVLADAGEDRGYILAPVDPAKITEARAMIPSLQHDRPIESPL